MSQPPPERLSDMVNLGPVTAAQLPAVGIATPDELDRVGAVAAYRRLEERFGARNSLNALYALEGALLGVRWDHLPPDVRERLRREATDP